MLRILRWLGLAAEKSRPRPARNRSTRLQVERLEDRRLLSAVSVMDAANHTNLFAVGLDNQVYQQQYDSNGAQTRGMSLTAPGHVKEISAVELATGGPLLFARGLDDQVWEQWFDGQGNSEGGYKLAAVGHVQHIEAVVTAAGVPLVFATGLDGQIWELTFDATGKPTGGYTLPQPGAVLSFAVTGVTAYGLNSGGPVLFARGLDQQVYQQQYSPSGALSTGFALMAPGAVKDFSFSASSNAFFAIGLDSQVYQMRLDANGNLLNGYTLVQPGQVKAISQASYVLPVVGIINPWGGIFAPELFVVGLDDRVYAEKVDASGNPLQGYTLTAPGGVNAILTWNLPVTKRPLLFAQGKDGQIYEQTLDLNGNSTSAYTATGSGVVLW
jgi:hypothetical protein